MAEEKREIVKENYSKLQKKRKKALDALEGNVSIIVSKENIVHDLISVYKDPSILEKNVSAVIEGAEATGDGVLREVYSLFWTTFLSQSDGDSEHPIPVLPDLNQEDYVLKHWKDFDASVCAMRCLPSQGFSSLCAADYSWKCHRRVQDRVISSASATQGEGVLV